MYIPFFWNICSYIYIYTLTSIFAYQYVLYTHIYIYTCMYFLMYLYCFSPPARWGLLDFYVSCPPPPSLPSPGPPPRRTSTASSWSQWASPGPHLPALYRSGPRRTSTGPCRTSTGEIRSTVGLAGTQPDPNGQKQSHIECQRECRIDY